MLSKITKVDILNHLDHITRETNLTLTDTFTTTRIALECNVSRNLASQYLNELVREGLVIKIQERPILFLHKRSIERFLQKKLDQCEFASLESFLSSVNITGNRGFTKIVGADLSLSSSIEQLKSAMKYPPNGIPILLIGDHGTGKRLLSVAAFEFCQDSHIIPSGASYIPFDCSRYEENETAIEADLFGNDSIRGAVNEASGGVVYLTGFDHLSQATRQLLLQRICDTDNLTISNSNDQTKVRFILSTARHSEDSIVRSIARSVPIVVALPKFAERTLEERSILTMYFLQLEGRRTAADISISRGALRALVETNFEENIDGLKSCVVNCCAQAYLNRKNEQLIIHTYNLPSTIIAKVEPQPDDGQLVDGNVYVVNKPKNKVTTFLQLIIDSYESYCAGNVTFTDIITKCFEEARSLQDYLNFENTISNSRVMSYEQVINPFIDEVNRMYGLELSHKIAHSLAQCLYLQQYGGIDLFSWIRKNNEIICRMIASLKTHSKISSTVVEKILSKTFIALGIKPNSLTSLLLYLEINDSLKSIFDIKDILGVIVCHGYSTATSIADAANRLLHQRVYEAIDMPYDQDVNDAIGKISNLLERFSHCHSVIVLFDIGSLDAIADNILEKISSKLIIAENVSLGLALEVGSAIASHDDLHAALDRATTFCTPKYKVMSGRKNNEAIVFCSESGTNAAEKIRLLVRNSLPEELSISFLTYDFSEIMQRGDQSILFETYKVKAIVGTMNPGITSIPFIALEDILYSGSSEALDKVLFPFIGPKGVETFHSQLLRNLTLKNVFESISILNPEMLFIEADRAVKRFTELSGQLIDARRQIGLYVHLCGLIERLITKNFVETYPNVEDFEKNNVKFISWFQEAFSEMCHRYHVEIPVSEIAYVYHMISTDSKIDISGSSKIDLLLEDE